jgi:hypothetical protein
MENENSTELEATPLTWLQILLAKNPELQKKKEITMEDCWDQGIDMIGGCEICQATIAVYNAFPSHSGHWRCKYCIEDTGWTNMKEALEDLFYCSIDPKLEDDGR